MYLHRLVRGSINAVNRDKQIVWFASQGPIVDVTGIATPTYAPAQPVWAQIQPLTTDQLAHMENLNIQGVLRQIYLRNAIASAVREDGTGGDLLQFPERWTTLAENVMAAWTADSQITADSGSSASGTPPWAPPPVRTWLVMAVPEQWNSWCKVIVRMQNDQNYIWTADSGTTADSPGSEGDGVNADSNVTADSSRTADA